jgi:spermidine synthase/MFS family permease
MKHKKDKAKARNDEAAPAGGRRILELASFLCGTAVMVLEMAGSRVVAPYMGTSLIVWTALIGVIMASLSAGYWLGGIVADRRPEAGILARIVLGAALLTGLAALAANPVLGALSRLPGLYLAPVAGAVALFAAPGMLLGMVSPFIVRLAMRGVDSSGATVGRFSALSATGSILGTFLGGFVLIAHFASGTVLLLVAAVLACVAALLQWRAARGSGAAGALLGLALLGLSWMTGTLGLPFAPPGAHIDTLYNHILVADQKRFDGQHVRYLMTGAIHEGAQSVVYPEKPDELASDYTKFYDLAFHYRPMAKKILMLGGGGYCVPRHLLATRNVSVDVVEIDPGITAAARQYFFLRDEDHPGLSIRHEDARMFLNRETEKRKGAYEAIFADVFGSWYSIPFHLTTVEAARAMSGLLDEDGILVSNVISSLRGPGSGVLGGIYAALSEVFPKVLVFPASRPQPEYAGSRQNIMLVAFKSEKTFTAAAAAFPGSEAARLLSHRWTAPFNSSARAFTDAFAPVEHYALIGE